MHKEINLTFKREDFENIYFRNNQGSFTKSPTVKTAWQALLIALAVALTSAVIAYVTNKGGFAMVLAVIAVLVTATWYIRCAVQLFKWKESIHLYLDEVAAVDISKIVLTDTTFGFMQDGKEILEKWELFNKITIEPGYILLNSNGSYLFPESSMTPEEFEFLKDFARARVTKRP